MVVRKLKSVRVPDELTGMDFSALVKELEQARARLSDAKDLADQGKKELAKELRDLATAKLGEGVARLVEAILPF